MKKEEIVLGLTRLALGFILLWAFLDKLLGLGFSTLPEKSWIMGNSPTAGFLSNTSGIFSNLFQQLSGSIIVDWLFMLGLLLIGLALILGIGVKIAGYSGALLMLLMWLASILPKNNPIIDDHIVYGLLLLLFTTLPVGNWIGLGKYWKKLDLVKQNSWLQ